MKKFLEIRRDLLYLSIYIIIVTVFLYNLIFSDKIFIFRDWYIPYNTKNYFLYAWNDELLGHINMFRSVDIVTLFLSYIFGMSIAMKILFLSIFILPYISFYFLSRNAFKVSPLPAFLASIIYSINPVTIELLWGGNGAISTGIIYGTVPICYYLIIKIFAEHKFIYILLFSIIISFISYNVWQLLSLLLPILLFHLIVSIDTKVRYRDVIDVLFRSSQIILLSLILSLPNLFFNYSRTYMMRNYEMANDIIMSNLKWGYQYINISNLLQFKFNASNYFIYKTCYLLNGCNFGYVYTVIFMFILIGTIIICMREWNKKLFVSTIFSILILLSILIISIILDTSNIRNINEILILILGIFRNPDKLSMIFIFFMSLSFGILTNILFEKFLKRSILCYLFGFMTVISLLLLLLPTDGFGGLTKYYFSDYQENLRLLTISNEADLPHIISGLNISDERILYLPYCTNGLVAVGDQPKTQPFILNVLGIRQGGIVDGYNQKLIDNMFDFYSYILNENADAINTYLTILNTDYIIISKNSYSKNKEVVTLGTSKVHYICGSPDNFIKIFRNMDYISVFEDDNYMIFKKPEKSLPLIYGLSEHRMDSTSKFARYNYCDKCITNVSHEPLNNYILSTRFNLTNSGKNNWNSFSIYIFDDWNNFIRVSFLTTGGIEIEQSKDGKYSPYKAFKLTPPIKKDVYYNVRIIKFDNYLGIQYRNRSLSYIDKYVNKLPFVMIRFNDSEGTFFGPSISSINVTSIDYRKIDPTKYLVNTTDNTTFVIFSENYDDNWIIQTKDKNIKSENSFFGFNSFETENIAGDNILYYNIQDKFKSFRLASLGTIQILLIMIIIKRIIKNK